MQSMSSPSLVQRDNLQDLALLFSGMLNKEKGFDGNLDLLQNVWYDEKQLRSKVPQSDDLVTAFETPRRHLKRFSDMLDTLQALIVALQMAAGEARSRINTASLHEGINKLPNEVLCIIMAHAASTVEDASRLSRVCRRFREMILSAPRIWASCELSVNMTPSKVATIVRRSKGLPLIARIDSGPYIPLNADAVSRNTASIGELSVTQVDSPILCDYFAGLHLPSLRRLSMRWSGLFRTDSTDERSLHIYDTWSMPRVEHLDANFVPRPIFGESLIQCTLEFDSSTLRVSELLEFLGSCPSLESLNISFIRASAWLEATSNRSVLLPSLKCLSLKVTDDTSPRLLRQVLANLDSKRLSDITIIVEETPVVEEQYHDAFGETIHDIANGAKSRGFEEHMNILVQYIKNQRGIRAFRAYAEKMGHRCPGTVSQLSGHLETLLLHLPASLETLEYSGYAAYAAARRERTQDPRLGSPQLSSGSDQHQPCFC